MERDLKFLDFANQILSVSENPLTYQEIWERGVSSGLIERLDSKGKTPWQTLGARLFVDVRDNPDSKFVKVGGNPARFFLRNRSGEITQSVLNTLKSDAVEKPNESSQFRERDLHSLLAYFVYSSPTFNRGRQIYSKTIFHEKSRHSEINEWTHPDMVGFHNPIEEWDEKLMALSKVVDRSNIKFYSFELKRRTNRSNYREQFFQAVSNSSWANEGYLVTASIEQRDDLLSELERLSTAFGIGIIRLDLEDIDSSEVAFPAKERTKLDWELMNKLCEQNDDFASFIDNVRKDYEVNTIHAGEYDSIIDDAEGFARNLLNRQV
jgi:hypothetical protein